MKKGIVVKPVGKKYPRMIITAKELGDILELITVEFDHNKEWKEYFPHLDIVCAKLAVFAD